MQKLVILLFFILVISRINAATITVGQGLKYAGIVKAIAACNDHDTILVTKGIYHEGNISITKKIILLTNENAIIDGDSKWEIISIKADSVEIKGFSLQNAGKSSVNDIAAIKIYGTRGAVIEGNTISNCFFGILSLSAVNGKIIRNKITGSGNGEEESGNGVHCWKCDSMQVIANTISACRDGIYFEFVTNSLIWRNTSEHNIRYGLHFMFSHNDAYITNSFSYNGAGVAVMYTHGVRMFNNVFQHNWGEASYGLLLKEISDSYIEGNKFIENTSAIFMEGGSRNLICKNNFKNNGWAMQVQASCNGNTIAGNNFTGNTFDVGTNGTLALNSFNHNYWDKYEGYDINRDGCGDVPYRPVSLYSMVTARTPPAMILYRSLIVALMDKTEKVLPGITPEGLKDDYPLMKPLPL
ncbi:MAG TPA: nitrous oxide reductase family maturation protein NosD [Chitinophagaceae bacterium]|nr:nitrous oxide reductase family maturation protein NosD [Chitinophagaceae bacterium]